MSYHTVLCLLHRVCTYTKCACQFFGRTERRRARRVLQTESLTFFCWCNIRYSIRLYHWLQGETHKSLDSKSIALSPWTMMAFAASKYIAPLLLLSVVVFADAQYLSSPAVGWTYQLPGSGTLSGRGVRRSNAVVSSYDGSTVFVTADDGSLHIIKPADLSTSVVVDAPSEQSTYTECRSGVALSETDGSVNFAVYAAILTQRSSTNSSNQTYFSTQATRYVSETPRVQPSLEMCSPVSRAVV